VQQLEHAIDSLETQMESISGSLQPSLNSTYYIYRKNAAEIHELPAVNYKSFLESVPDTMRPNLIAKTLQSVRGISRQNAQTMQRLIINHDKIVDHEIEWHRKFVLSLACLLFMFVGAPLGSIIRKGGFGLPVIFSILIFIFFYVLNISGEKMAESKALTPFAGMWLALFVIFPFSILLTVKATNDSPIIDREWYFSFWSRFKSRLKHR
jgi:lipopolysaccharide export system permease protein